MTNHQTAVKEKLDIQGSFPYRSPNEKASSYKYPSLGYKNGETLSAQMRALTRRLQRDENYRADYVQGREMRRGASKSFEPRTIMS
jgi:hypothetical protein